LEVFWGRRVKEAEPSDIIEMDHLLQTMKMFGFDIGQQVSVVESDAVVKSTNASGLPFFGNLSPIIF
jgi:hypothetical protein